MRQPTEAENIRVNAGMVRNLLDGLRAAGGGVRHVALVTGLKHYLGPFEAYGKGELPETPFREARAASTSPTSTTRRRTRFFAAARRDGFTWSVHRPHTVIGKAVGNAMNMGTTLAVYATLCRETGRPFRFPGSAAQWNGLTDMTSASQLARHLLWAATTRGSRRRGVQHRQRRRLPLEVDVGAHRGLVRAGARPFDGTVIPLEDQMRDDAPVWRRIAEREGLAEADLDRWPRPGTRMPTSAVRSR